MPYQKAVLSLEDAWKAIGSGEALKAPNRPIAIAMCDDQGELVAFARMDRCARRSQNFTLISRLIRLPASEPSYFRLPFENALGPKVLTSSARLIEQSAPLNEPLCMESSNDIRSDVLKKTHTAAASNCLCVFSPESESKAALRDRLSGKYSRGEVSADRRLKRRPNFIRRRSPCFVPSIRRSSHTGVPRCQK